MTGQTVRTNALNEKFDRKSLCKTGISSSLPIAGQASGSFAAGFLGTSAATTATSSFVSGALIGGGAGLAGGFTTGFGNALIDGKNVGQALGQGGIYGAVGMSSGTLIGGLIGGIDAARNGRTFWRGGAIAKEPLAYDYSFDGIHDGAPPFWNILGDGKDRYRTAAAQLGWGDWNLRLNMMTGPGASNDRITGYSSKYYYGYYYGDGVDDVRLGALSFEIETPI